MFAAGVSGCGGESRSYQFKLSTVVLNVPRVAENFQIAFSKLRFSPNSERFLQQIPRKPEKIVTKFPRF
jgi:hypothetical protein